MSLQSLAGANGARVSLQKQIEAEPINEYISGMTSGGRAGVLADHNTLRKKERHVCYFMRNTSKNRFSNIVHFNEGAVQLEKINKGDSSYIHATQIKSKYGNYILAQAPKPETLIDWYRMIWQYRVQIIVCLVPLNNKADCVKYFEKKTGKKVKCKAFSVKTFTVHDDGPVDIYELRMTNKDAKENDREERVIHVVHYPKWKTHHEQVDPREVLKVIRATWALESSPALANEKWEITCLVHGKAGVLRTGSFVIVSMLCKQMRDTSKASFISACCTVRRYRYGVMRSKLIYAITLEAVLNFAADQGLIDRGNPNFVTAIKTIRSALVDPVEGDDPKKKQGSQRASLRSQSTPRKKGTNARKKESTTSRKKSSDDKKGSLESQKKSTRHKTSSSKKGSSNRKKATASCKTPSRKSGSRKGKNEN